MRANKPSATALLIAAGISFCARDPRLQPLIPPLAAEASDWFTQNASPHGSWLLRVMDKRWFRALVRLAEWATIPGLLPHYVVRKCYLEEIARRCLSEGYRQVVVLGSGLDTLALRLHVEFPDVLFLEMDHPATQQVKRRILQSHLDLQPNLQFLPIDLSRQPLEQKLSECHTYRPHGDTLFLAEGLLMYLKPDAVDALFHSLHGPGGRRLCFAFTFMERQDDGKIDFRNATFLARWWLKRKGEPFQWGISTGKIEAYLETRGFRLQEISTTAMFRQRYLNTPLAANVVLAVGEYVCVAERK